MQLRLQSCKFIVANSLIDNVKYFLFRYHAFTTNKDCAVYLQNISVWFFAKAHLNLAFSIYVDHLVVVLCEEFFLIF